MNSSNLQTTCVEAQTREGVSLPAQSTVNATAGELVAANANRRSVLIVNTGTTVIYLAFGDATPTSTAYHLALKACSGANDGTGGYLTESELATLAIQAISSADGGTCVVTEVE